MRVVANYDNIRLFRHLKIVHGLPTKCLATKEFFKPEQLTIEYRMSTDNRESVVGIWVPIEARISGSMVERPASGHAYGDRTYTLTNKNVRVPRDLLKLVRDYNPGYNRPA